jgi:phosphate transport system substrate-binding protein
MNTPDHGQHGPMAAFSTAPGTAARGAEAENSTLMHRISRLALKLSVLAGLCAGGPIVTALPAVAQALPNAIQTRLAGSSTLGMRMTQELAIAWGKKLGLPSVRVHAGLNPDEYEVLGDRLESTRRLRVEVKAKGTGAGLEPLLRGQADLWMASRPVRDSDLEAMRRRGIADVPRLAQFQAAGIENVVAFDTVVVITHPGNPVKRLTLTQIRDLYAGRINNWARVGGPDLPVALYSLEASHGTTDFFCSSVIGISDSAKCLRSMARLAAPRFQVSEDMPDAVSGNPGAIGFIDAGRKRNAHAVQIGTDCGPGTEVDSSRAGPDASPLSRRLYLYMHPTRPLNPATRSYLDFVLSAEGQAVLARLGIADWEAERTAENPGAGQKGTAPGIRDGGRPPARSADIRGCAQASDRPGRPPHEHASLPVRPQPPR